MLDTFLVFQTSCQGAVDPDLQSMNEFGFGLYTFMALCGESAQFQVRFAVEAHIYPATGVWCKLTLPDVLQTHEKVVLVL